MTDNKHPISPPPELVDEWRRAPEYTDGLKKLPRNGPKPGQSTSAWLYGKDRNCQKERDAAKWTIPLQSDKP